MKAEVDKEDTKNVDQKKRMGRNKQKTHEGRARNSRNEVFECGAS